MGDYDNKRKPISRSLTHDTLNARLETMPVERL